jgi:hypothetical protein
MTNTNQTRALNYSTALNRVYAMFDQIAAVAIAHDRLHVHGNADRVLREQLARSIGDLAGLGDTACNELVGRNAAGERVQDWADYTALPEFEAALGMIWPLFNQIVAIADAYIPMNRCNPQEQDAARDELMAAVNSLAEMGKGECNKWEEYEADARLGKRGEVPHAASEADAPKADSKESPNGEPVPLFPGDSVRYVANGYIGKVVCVFDNGDAFVSFPMDKNDSWEQRIPRPLLREVLRHE